jgi:hypothetical protein
VVPISGPTAHSSRIVSYRCVNRLDFIGDKARFSHSTLAFYSNPLRWLFDSHRGLDSPTLLERVKVFVPGIGDDAGWATTPRKFRSSAWDSTNLNRLPSEVPGQRIFPSSGMKSTSARCAASRICAVSCVRLTGSYKPWMMMQKIASWATQPAA